MSSLTQDRLKEILHYNPETGVFTWKQSLRYGFKGKRAGSRKATKRGVCYEYIRVDRKLYIAHRLAFLYMEGAFPPDEVDHINRDTTDNSWINLRKATRAENLRNSSVHSDSASGAKGVSWDKVNQKWVAQICVHGKNMHLGRFLMQEDAMRAYVAAEKVYKASFKQEI